MLFLYNPNLFPPESIIPPDTESPPGGRRAENEGGKQSLSKDPMTDPWEWYIYLHWSHKNQPNVGEYIYIYITYMDPMGMVVLRGILSPKTPCWNLGNFVTCLRFFSEVWFEKGEVFFGGFFFWGGHFFFFFGPLVPWLRSPGPPVLWSWSPVLLSSGPLVLQSPGPLILRSSGPLVPRSSCPLVPWSSGLVVVLVYSTTTTTTTTTTKSTPAMHSLQWVHWGGGAAPSPPTPLQLFLILK